MPTAIIVASVGKRPWFSITLKWLNAYAKNFNYDLIVCRQPAWEADQIPGFDRYQNYGRVQKLGIAKYFDIYDRLIQLDDTCLIAPGTPSLTDLVPQDCIGSFVNGAEVRGIETYLEAHRTNYGRLSPLPASRFFNAGVCVFSRQHKVLFDEKKIPWQQIAADSKFPVQGYFSHTATELGLSYFDLGQDYNLCGGPLKRLGGPENAPKSTRVFHLTSALTPEQRLDFARRIDRIFTSRVQRARQGRMAAGSVRETSH